MLKTLRISIAYISYVMSQVGCSETTSFLPTSLPSYLPAHPPTDVPTYLLSCLYVSPTKIWYCKLLVNFFHFDEYHLFSSWQFPSTPCPIPFFPFLKGCYSLRRLRHLTEFPISVTQRSSQVHFSFCVGITRQSLPSWGEHLSKGRKGVPEWKGKPGINRW